MVNIRDLSKEKLVEILKEAAIANRDAASKVQDGASCSSFPSAFLSGRFRPSPVRMYWTKEQGRWSKKLEDHLKEAAKEVGVYVSYWKRTKELYFGFRSYGQGYKRTVGMEAASKVLNKHGIDTSVRYVLD